MLLGIHIKRNFDVINSTNEVSISRLYRHLQLDQIILDIHFINFLSLTQCRIAYKYINQFSFINLRQSNYIKPIH